MGAAELLASTVPPPQAVGPVGHTLGGAPSYALPNPPPDGGASKSAHSPADPVPLVGRFSVHNGSAIGTTPVTSRQFARQVWPLAMVARLENQRLRQLAPFRGQGCRWRAVESHEALRPDLPNTLSEGAVVRHFFSGGERRVAAYYQQALSIFYYCRQMSQVLVPHRLGHDKAGRALSPPRPWHIVDPQQD